MKKAISPGWCAPWFCFALLSQQLSAGTLSGVVSYHDEQTGLIQITATRTISGNKALKLDGTGDYAVVHSLTDLSGPELSIQYWFRGSSFQSAVRQQSNNGYIVAGWNNQHILSHDGGLNGISAGENLTDGQWHHIAMTWKQGTPGGFASYLDGQLISSRNAVDAPIPAHNAPLYFGAFNGTGEFANGKLDEIAVWQRALTPEEIRSNWSQKLSGNEEGLVGYWTFDDGTADDQSPNEHHGELHGDAVISGLKVFFTTELSAPGPYTIANIPNNSGYHVTAFLDADGDGHPGKTEPAAAYTGNPFTISGDQTGIDLLLVEPPQITKHPADIRAGAGENIQLHVAASGSQPLSYQWRRKGQDLADGRNFSGATSPALAINNAAGHHSGTYNCRIANATGETLSSTANVFIIEGGRTLSGTIRYDGSQQGRIHIAAAQTQAGNRVLSLDGNGNFATTTLTNLSGNAITIQYWFRGSSVQSAVRQQSNNGYIVAGWDNKNTFSFEHILSFDGGTVGLPVGMGATDGHWRHLTMTWKQGAPGGFASYLDGRLIARRDSTNTEIPNIGEQVHFGAFNGTGEFANGKLDEIAVWERALSESEIFTGWNNPLTGNEEGLLGFWNFDDGEGQDLTAFGNHAELHGAAAILEETVPELGSSVFTATLKSPGPYTIANILPGNNFEVIAFLDANGNGSLDKGELADAYANNPFSFAKDLAGIDITLTEPPRILNQPADIRVRANTADPAAFTINAAGSAPLFYQWRKDGQSLAPTNNNFQGVNSPTLTILNPAQHGPGEYSVIVANKKGSALSREAKLSAVPADSVSLYGSLQYTGAPAGKIHLIAANFLPNNQALKLDGDGDFVVVPELTNLSGTAITIQYWFRGRFVQSAIRQQSNNGYIVAGWNNQHILSHDGGLNGIAAGKNLTDGQWHHIAMTWEINTPNGFRSYLDGKLIEQRDSANKEIPHYTAALYFGTFNGTSEFAGGELDEIAVWNRALDESEIQSNWNQPLESSEDELIRLWKDGLIGLWNFDDGTAKNAADNAASIYNFHGELHGNAAIVPANIPGFGSNTFTDVFDTPGRFAMSRLPKGKNYHLAAFVDVNGNYRPDPDEPFAVYSGNPFNLEVNLDGIYLDLGGETIETLALTIERDGDNIILPRPPENYGFFLFQTDTLSGGTWTLVEEGRGDGNHLVLPANQSARFYQFRDTIPITIELEPPVDPDDFIPINLE